MAFSGRNSFWSTWDGLSESSGLAAFKTLSCLWCISPCPDSQRGSWLLPLGDQGSAQLRGARPGSGSRWQPPGLLFCPRLGPCCPRGSRRKAGLKQHLWARAAEPLQGSPGRTHPGFSARIMSGTLTRKDFHGTAATESRWAHLGWLGHTWVRQEHPSPAPTAAELRVIKSIL